MIKTLSKTILLPLLFFCFLPIKANAFVISAEQTDSSGGDASFIFPCDVGFCLVEKTYVDVAPIAIDFTVLSLGGPELLFIEEEITNGTGEEWTDFHWALEPLGPVDPVFAPLDPVFLILHFVDAFAGGFDIATAFPATDVDALAIDPIAPGGAFPAGVFIEYEFLGVGSFRLTQVPTIDTPSVPEPTTLLLLGLGVAGLGFARRS